MPQQKVIQSLTVIAISNRDKTNLTGIELSLRHVIQNQKIIVPSGANLAWWFAAPCLYCYIRSVDSKPPPKAKHGAVRRCRESGTV